MTISLIPYQGDNPFKDYPILRTIWATSLQSLAERGTAETIQEEKQFYQEHAIQAPETLFLVTFNQKIIGLTGFYFAGESDAAHLRWHGIIPSHRQYGYSTKALQILATKLEKEYPHVQRLIENVPINEHYSSIVAYFQKVGFTSQEMPHFDSWSNLEWQSFSCNINTILSHHKEFHLSPMMVF